MRALLRRAARSLLAASVLGLIQPAGAQEALPRLQPIPFTPPRPADDNLILPRIVTANSDHSSVMTAPAAPIASTRMQPQIGVPAKIPPKPKVDLLKAPRVPSSWAVDTIKPPPKKIAESTPDVLAAPTATRSVSVDAPRKLDTALSRTVALPPLTTEVMPLPHLAPIPVMTVTSVSAPPAQPAPKTAVEPWAGQSQTKPIKKNEWPTAFVEPGRSPAPGLSVLRPVAMKSESPREAAGPIVPAVLHEKVARVCGGLAKDVKIEVRPDHGIDVHVVSVNQSSEHVLLDRLMTLPELSAPNVHVELDLMR